MGLEHTAPKNCEGGFVERHGAKVVIGRPERRKEDVRGVLNHSRKAIVNSSRQLPQIHSVVEGNDEVSVLGTGSLAVATRGNSRTNQ